MQIAPKFVCMENSLVNKVAQSGLITLNLEHYYPQGTRVFLDIKETLFMGMVLKEKDFRAWIKDHDWSSYADQHIAIGCSVDAIIPTWAYMLISSKLSGIAKTIYFGDLAGLENKIWEEQLKTIDFSAYQDAKMVIKGCSDIEVPAYAYVYVTEKLVHTAQSIMYGEPCSTVPVYKRKKQVTE